MDITFAVINFKIHLATFQYHTKSELNQVFLYI